MDKLLEWHNQVNHLLSDEDADFWLTATTFPEGPDGECLFLGDELVAASAETILQTLANPPVPPISPPPMPTASSRRRAARRANRRRQRQPPPPPPPLPVHTIDPVQYREEVNSGRIPRSPNMYDFLTPLSSPATTASYHSPYHFPDMYVIHGDGAILEQFAQQQQQAVPPCVPPLVLPLESPLSRYDTPQQQPQPTVDSSDYNYTYIDGASYDEIMRSVSANPTAGCANLARQYVPQQPQPQPQPQKVDCFGNVVDEEAVSKLNVDLIEKMLKYDQIFQMIRSLQVPAAPAPAPVQMTTTTGSAQDEPGATSAAKPMPQPAAKPGCTQMDQTQQTGPLRPPPGIPYPLAHSEAMPIPMYARIDGKLQPVGFATPFAFMPGTTHMGILMPIGLALNVHPDRLQIQNLMVQPPKPDSCSVLTQTYKEEFAKACPPLNPQPEVKAEPEPQPEPEPEQTPSASGKATHENDHGDGHGRRTFKDAVTSPAPVPRRTIATPAVEAAPAAASSSRITRNRLSNNDRVISPVSGYINSATSQAQHNAQSTSTLPPPPPPPQQRRSIIRQRTPIRTPRPADGQPPLPRFILRAFSPARPLSPEAARSMPNTPRFVPAPLVSNAEYSGARFERRMRHGRHHYRERHPRNRQMTGYGHNDRRNGGGEQDRNAHGPFNRCAMRPPPSDKPHD